MSKVAVVYWSMTGNTEAMANAVAEGALGAGAEVDLLTAADFGADRLNDYDAVGFGCPAMGDEVLEEDEFDPMFTACEGSLSGKDPSAVKKSRCLAPMTGVTENGCASGKDAAKQPVQTSPAIS